MTRTHGVYAAGQSTDNEIASILPMAGNII